MFADIKGSTEPEQHLDPEEARATIDPALKLMIDAVRDGVSSLPTFRASHPTRKLKSSSSNVSSVRDTLLYRFYD